MCEVRKHVMSAGIVCGHQVGHQVWTQDGWMHGWMNEEEEKWRENYQEWEVYCYGSISYPLFQQHDTMVMVVVVVVVMMMMMIQPWPDYEKYYEASMPWFAYNYIKMMCMWCICTQLTENYFQKRRNRVKGRRREERRRVAVVMEERSIRVVNVVGRVKSNGNLCGSLSMSLSLSMSMDQYLLSHLESYWNFKA